MRVGLIAWILGLLPVMLSSQQQREGNPANCRTTKTAPGSRYGNEFLSTTLWPDGVVVFEPGGSGFVLASGVLEMKFPWWRLVKGRLRIEGRRLDGPALPLRADIPEIYGDTGFQATGLIFPTAGCWEVTGRVGEGQLTFVTKVVKIGDGPSRQIEAGVKRQ